MATKTAQLVAWTVMVECPHCGEPQPAPDNGSDSWMPPLVAQAAAAKAERACVACERPFRIVMRRQARIGF